MHLSMFVLPPYIRWDRGQGGVLDFSHTCSKCRSLVALVSRLSYFNWSPPPPDCSRTIKWSSPPPQRLSTLQQNKCFPQTAAEHAVPPDCHIWSRLDKSSHPLVLLYTILFPIYYMSSPYSLLLFSSVCTLRGSHAQRQRLTEIRLWLGLGTKMNQIARDKYSGCVQAWLCGYLLEDSLFW